MSCVARIDDGVVTQVIVGDAEWANDRLAGTWVDAPNGTSVGYVFVDGEFRSPVPYPSWVWDGTEYQPPVPQPEATPGFGWDWDESAGEWVQFALEGS